MLNPESFESPEDLRKALIEDGFAKGWTPISHEFPISLIPRKISEAGKRMANKILKTGGR